MSRFCRTFHSSHVWCSYEFPFSEGWSTCQRIKSLVCKPFKPLWNLSQLLLVFPLWWLKPNCGNCFRQPTFGHKPYNMCESPYGWLNPPTCHHLGWSKNKGYRPWWQPFTSKKYYQPSKSDKPEHRTHHAVGYIPLYWYHGIPIKLLVTTPIFPSDLLQGIPWKYQIWSYVQPQTIQTRFRSL